MMPEERPLALAASRNEFNSTERKMAEDEMTFCAWSGGIWGTESVDEQPELTLTSWSVRQLADGDRHLVGWCVENREGRTTSKIVRFDSQALRGVTSSGRVYQLSGPPGFNTDADYVWSRWLRINRLKQNEWTDVTANIVVSR